MSYLLAAAAIVQAFNLNCSGVSDLNSGSMHVRDKFTTTYRIDLGVGKWCADECKDISRFADIQPSRLVFINEGATGTTAEDRRLVYVDRDTGRFSSFISSDDGSGRLVVKDEGVCERMPFTGWPRLQRKF